FRLADRLLFQLLSRIEPDDPDRGVAQRAQELLIEYQKPAKSDAGLGRWARRLGREAAACALARAGHIDDPRVRGTAHTIASNISQYLRIELAVKPFKKAQSRTVLELLTRLGLVRNIPSAGRVLARLFNECDEQGIWSPKSLRALPKAISPVSAHYFPLEGPGKSPAQRQTDVTFRLALIARLMGL